jgi:serpin B
MALTMTYNGAQAETRMAMAEVLNLGKIDVDTINHWYRMQRSRFAGLEPALQMSIANSIWIRQGLEIRQEFCDTGDEFYAAQVRELDFAIPTAAGLINDWVEECTEGRIQGIIEPPIPASTPAYLLSATYFKGNWKYRFSERSTFNHYFTLADSSQVPCEYMRQAARLQYFSTQQYEAVELPYSAGTFSMMLLLPAPGLDPRQLAADFCSSSFWMQLTIGPSSEEVLLELPKFELESDLVLNQPLSAMGMQIAFTEAADFGGIAGQGPLWIDEV